MIVALPTELPRPHTPRNLHTYIPDNSANSISHYPVIGNPIPTISRAGLVAREILFNKNSFCLSRNGRRIFNIIYPLFIRKCVPVRVSISARCLALRTGFRSETKSGSDCLKSSTPIFKQGRMLLTGRAE